MIKQKTERGKLGTRIQADTKEMLRAKDELDNELSSAKRGKDVVKDQLDVIADEV